ncbi:MULTISPECIES: hypothetical protein [Pseudomonas]|nr:hypothetical protein [Pseudomonas sp. Ost2]
MTDSTEVIKYTLPQPHLLELSGDVLHVPDLGGGPATAEVRYDGIKAGDSILLVGDRLVDRFQIPHTVSASEASSGKATIKIENRHFLYWGEHLDLINLYYVVSNVGESVRLLFRLTY